MPIFRFGLLVHGPTADGSLQRHVDTLVRQERRARRLDADPTPPPERSLQGGD